MPEPIHDFRVADRPLRLGVVTSEVFDTRVGGIGGFGWATRQVCKCFSEQPGLGVEVMLLMARRVDRAVTKYLPELHGVRVLWPDASVVKHFRAIRREKLDLLLTIDLQMSFRLFTWALPGAPVIHWIRDPWPEADRAAAATLRIPGDSAPAQGLLARDLRGLRYDFLVWRLLRRSALMAAPARFLAPKIPATYGLKKAEVHFLPNPLQIEPAPGRTERPSVVVVGRLDPVKRPWLAVAVAEQVPEADFIFLGNNHFSGPGAWQPGELPPNVRLAGHADEQEKVRRLSSAWALLNTSIHEGLPVTFQEALACGTPIVSCVDPEQVVSRFGRWVGEAGGDGLALAPKFADELRVLFSDAALRERLGAAGREWMAATHGREAFLSTFHTLCAKAGVFS